MVDDENRQLIRKDLELEEILRLATPDELDLVVTILLDNVNDRVLGDEQRRQHLARCQENGEPQEAIAEVAFEIRALGSNGVASFVRRGQPVPYDEVVRDVAKGLAVDFSQEEPLAQTERRILETLAARLDEEQSEESVNEGGRGNEREVAGLSTRTILRGSMSGMLGRVAGSAIGMSAAKAGLIGVGAVASLPVTVLVGYGAYAMANRNQVRPELQSLRMIVVQVARIRSRVQAEDRKAFVSRLRACL